jgi:hypothetical protein
MESFADAIKQACDQSRSSYSEDLQDQCRLWAESLSEDSKLESYKFYNAIHYYTQSGYHSISTEIRHWLYGISDLTPLSFNFCRGVKTAPIYEGILFRGVPNKRKIEYKVGDSFLWSQFTSTSISLNTARGFAKEYRDGVHYKGVIFAIQNARGFCIKHASDFANEQESILPPSELRVVNVGNTDCEGQSYTVVLCEIVRSIPLIKGSLVC